MLKITIHRPKQIGGQITEITTSKGTRIIIDLGLNLSGKDPLNNKEAIERLTKGSKAVLYTHYHGDHVGLCHLVPSDVPQYIGSIANKVMRCRYEKLSGVDDEETSETADETLKALERMNSYTAGVPLKIEDVTVTPYLVSHSACDAHMFLIEADGKRILHTGDFREHSKVGSRLMDMVKNDIGSVDVLITEGTMLARSNEKVDTEEKLSEKAETLMKKYKYVFIHCSSTDLERLYGFTKAHRAACPKAPLVCDKYQQEVINVFSSVENEEGIPYNFGEVYAYSMKNVRLKRWMKAQGLTMFVRASDKSDKFFVFLDNILPMLDPSQTLFIYSMWSGYLDRSDTFKPENKKLQDYFSGEDFPPIERLHTSGHATMETLRKVCETLNPTTAIIPIHRDKDTSFGNTKIKPELQEKIVTVDCTIDGVEISFLY